MLMLSAEFDDFPLPKERCCDVSADADDEEDISRTDSEKTTGYLSEDARSKERSSDQESDNSHINVTKEHEKECTSIENKEGQTSDKITLEPTKGKDLEIAEDETSSSKEITLHVETFSYSEVTEIQTSTTRETAHLSGVNLYTDEGHGEKQTENKEKVNDMVNASFEDEVVKEESARRKSKISQRKGTDGLKETSSRPRSRTFSSRNVFSFDEKEGRSRYTRQSKSVSLPEKSSGSKGQRKGTFGKKENERSISDFPASPSTPREAFSDVENAVV